MRNLAKLSLISLIGATTMLTLFFSVPVFAKKTFNDAGQSLGVVADKTGHEKVGLTDYLPRVITTAFAAVGATFLALMVYAGMKWMTAGGNSDRVETAQSTLSNAAIGLIVIVAAYTITSFITNRLVAPSGATGGDPAFNSEYGGDTIGCCLWEQSAAWGNGMLTSSQCKDWKDSHPGVVLQTIWDGSIKTSDLCIAAMDKKEALD